ncbi:uncharacterized protein JCM6883_004513 [Sporobolomyces salmoneus]|uniref:uncharacterized protein n=1 Tax=Sporobolomyces salmoneus TaxID=183962 RepID=UPI0031776AD9
MSPPCRRLSFKGYQHDVVIESRHGVKVKDFLREVFESWDLEAPDEFCLDLLERLEEELADDEEFQEKLEQRLNYCDLTAGKDDNRVKLYVALESGQPLTWRMVLPPWARIERLKASRVIRNDHVKIESVWSSICQ